MTVTTELETPFVWKHPILIKYSIMRKSPIYKNMFNP